MNLEEIKTVIPTAISIEPFVVMRESFGFPAVMGFKVFYTGKAPQWKSFKIGQNRYKWHYDPVPLNTQIKERIYKPQSVTHNGITTRF